MSYPQEYTVVLAPREGVNDDVVRVVEWLVADRARVGEGDLIAILETTKATFDLMAPRAGHVHRLVAAGAEIGVGMPLAIVSRGPGRPDHRLGPHGSPHRQSSGDRVITRKARELMERHGLGIEEFDGLPVVRSEDVEELLRRRDAGRSPGGARMFCGERLDPDTDWDALVEREEIHPQVEGLLALLRRRMKAKYNRHVPLGSLLYDRWKLAKDYGFGEGTSVYDECLILGDVTVGRHCWIGPQTILDGGHSPLRIGDYVDIGAGTHIYTHNTIDRALTGHRAPLFTRPTTIGNCCFIAPKAIIAPGTVIGDHCFVAAGSYVEGVFPAYSYIAGSPAKRAGTVEIHGDRVRIRVGWKKSDAEDEPQARPSRPGPGTGRADDHGGASHP
jgi:acetyltransferase-like isoleucine patch superfamily enzyme